MLDVRFKSSLNRTDKFRLFDFLLFRRQLFSLPSSLLLSISSSFDFLHDIFMKLPARTRSCRRLTIPSLLTPILQELCLTYIYYIWVNYGIKSYWRFLSDAVMSVVVFVRFMWNSRVEQIWRLSAQHASRCDFITLTVLDENVIELRRNTSRAEKSNQSRKLF